MHAFDEYVFDTRPDRAESHPAEPFGLERAEQPARIERGVGHEVVRRAERVALPHTGLAACTDKHAVHVRRRKGIERAVEGRDDPLRGIDPEDPAAVAQRNAVATPRLVHVGRRNQNRDALPSQSVEHLPELAARDGIDPRCRLVEQQHRGAVDQGTREGQFLLHAARELAGTPLAEGFDLAVDRGDQIVVFGHRRAEQRGEEGQILLDRQVGVEREAPGHVAHAAADGPVVAHDIQAVDLGTPGVRLKQRGQQPEEGRLAGAVGPDESEQFAAADGEAHPVERRQRTVAPGQRMYSDGLHHCGSLTSP